MHIHWLANYIIPPPISTSGGDRIMVECIRRWSQEHKITVYGCEGAHQLCSYYGLKGIGNVVWPSDQYQKYGRFVLWAAQTMIGLRYAKTMDLPDSEKHMIVATSEFMPHGCAALRLKRRFPHVPLVVGIHLMAPKWFSGEPGPGFVFTAYRPAQQAIIKRFLKEAEMILCTAEEDRQIFINMGRSPDSVCAVLGGVDLSIPRSVPEPPEKKFDAVYIGRLHWQKGPMELLDIWKLLLAKKPDARLAVIGSGHLDAEVKAKRDKLGLQKNVELFGFKDGVEKYHIVKASKIVVHPAVYDVGGMAAAEALAVGLPGVSFDLPALRAYYPRGFLKAKPGDFQGFADCLYRLATEPELYKTMSAEAYAAGQEWDWDARAKRILDAIFQRLENLKVAPALVS